MGEKQNEDTQPQDANVSDKKPKYTLTQLDDIADEVIDKLVHDYHFAPRELSYVADYISKMAIVSVAAQFAHDAIQVKIQVAAEYAQELIRQQKAKVGYDSFKPEDVI